MSEPRPQELPECARYPDRERTDAPKRRSGRPQREYLPTERVPMSFRVRPSLKKRMDATAAETGRSVAQEIEIRLEQSFRDDDLVQRIAAVLRDAEMSEPRPQELPECARHPGRKCPGECQYILPAHECIHDRGPEAAQ